ncbi:MAG: RNA polymerase sigma factor [Prevotella sp.]|nr:RNA polymerase sigma factor [Prevotella sp.]
MKNISFQTDVLPLKNQLFRLALRITLNHAEAEDVVQETMMKVWNKRDDWNQIESIEAFCLTICRNLSLDKLRHNSFSQQLTENSQQPVEHADNSYASNPEEQTIQRNRVELVRQLISRLPEKQRTAMQLRDIEGKSYRDIAEIMGITEEQVKVNIFRARQTIKKQFKQQEEYGL